MYAPDICLISSLIKEGSRLERKANVVFDIKKQETGWLIETTFVYSWQDGGSDMGGTCSIMSSFLFHIWNRWLK
jgi:hypothetical protein